MSVTFSNVDGFVGGLLQPLEGLARASRACGRCGRRVGPASRRRSARPSCPWPGSGTPPLASSPAASAKARRSTSPSPISIGLVVGSALAGFAAVERVPDVAPVGRRTVRRSACRPFRCSRLRSTSLFDQVTTSPVSYWPDGSTTRKFTRSALGGQGLVFELRAGVGDGRVLRVVDARRRAGILRIDAQADLARIVGLGLRDDLDGSRLLLRASW